MKKLLTAAAALAMICAATLPATLPASATSVTGTVKIQWNVTALLSMSLEGNYTNTGAGGVDNMTPLLIANGGTGNACGGGGTGGAGNGTSALTLDFGAITPSATVVTGCVGLNAAEAQISTNDAIGVQVQEALTTAPAQAGASICGVAIQGNKPVAWSATGVSSATFTAAAATDTTDTTATSWAGTTCTGLTYGGTSVNAAALTSTVGTMAETNNDTTNPIYVGEDYAVLLPANASKTAADSGTVTYTVLAN